MSFGLRLLPRAAALSADEWDACAAPSGDPTLTHRFFTALEESGSAAPEAGWRPAHLLLESDGRAAGIMPLYLKSHSYGEYVFDQPWAEAYGRAGGRYYPKLLGAVPFTPVPGPRVLLAPGAPEHAFTALVQGAIRMAREAGASSVHVNFCREAEQTAFAEMGFLSRLDVQYHWTDEGYGDYGGFLEALASRKRKDLRKERAAAQAGLEIVHLTGAALKTEHWDALWAFYQHTGARKWGRPYLTRDAFARIAAAMADDVLMILAREPGGSWIAGALNLIGREALYGRYWGALEERPFLHFEICYHQAIEAALARGLKRVEAGAQGDHKLARGYRPTLTRSAHLIFDQRLARPVADYLARERAAVIASLPELEAATPYKKP